MKIKHFSGYGSVDAKKVVKSSSTSVYNEDITKLVIRVKGNHEWGLVRDDSYDLYNWLIKRFDKNVKDYYEISNSLSYDVNDDFIDGVEVCEYTFTYKK